MKSHARWLVRLLSAVVIASAATLYVSGIDALAAQRSSVQCGAAKAKSAEDAAATVKNWREMYGTFVLYEDCDDGGIAEGFSGSTVTVLITRWNELHELASLAAKNPKFLAFILRHIDETSTREELQDIVELSRKSCPSKLSDLCRRLEREAQMAVKQLK